MTQTVMLRQQSRSVSLRAQSFNAEDNTVQVVFTTGAAVQRFSWGDGPYIEILDVTPKAVRLDRLNAGAPFLNTHSDWDLSDVLGVVVAGSARIEGGEGVATIKLSGDPAKAGFVGDIRDGIICNVSVGYIVHEVVRTEGKDGAATVCRVTDWEPIEISAVPIPADYQAQIRSAPAGKDAPTYACRVIDEAVAAPAAPAAPAAVTAPADPVVEAVAAERARTQGIRHVGRQLGSPEALIAAAEADGTTLDAFRALAIDARAANPPQTPAALAAPNGDREVTERALDTNTPPAAVPPAGAQPDAAAIRAAERLRIAEIRTTARKLGLPDDVVDRAVEAGVSIEAFRSTAIDAVAARGNDGQFSISLPASDPQLHRVHAQPAEKLPKGTDASRALLALAVCRGSKRDAADFVERQYGPSGQVLARALSTSIGTAGGFLVPDTMAAEVIELLRPKSAVMALGPRIVPMPTGNFSMARVAGGATAGYVGENNNIGASQPSFGKMQLSAKKLAALVPLSNDMLRFPSAAVDGVVRDDMIACIAQYTDFAFIRGSGTQYSPKGLRFLAEDPVLAGRAVLAAAPTPSLATVTTDLGRAELALANANVPMEQPGWIMSWRTRNFLYNLRDGLGNQIFMAEMDKGMLRGKPFRATTQVPDNLATVDGNGNAVADGSEIILADFAQVFVGEAYGLEIEVFPGGSYVDATGAMVSGISTDQTVMRAIVQHDINMRQQAAVAVLRGVRWY